MVVPFYNVIPLNKSFNPIEEALDQYHFIVAVFYKEITFIAKRRLN
jgi:hypothetical protein